LSCQFTSFSTPSKKHTEFWFLKRLIYSILCQPHEDSIQSAKAGECTMIIVIDADVECQNDKLLDPIQLIDPLLWKRSATSPKNVYSAENLRERFVQLSHIKWQSPWALLHNPKPGHGWTTDDNGNSDDSKVVQEQQGDVTWTDRLNLTQDIASTNCLTLLFTPLCNVTLHSADTLSWDGCLRFQNCQTHDKDYDKWI
jgi:hypothetical protein